MTHPNSPQNFHNPADTSSQQIIQLPQHPKIKPILSRYSTDNTINEPNLQRKIKLSSKTSKVIKSTLRHSSPEFIKGFFKVLKAQSSLFRLDYLFVNRPSFENYYLFSKLRDLSSLTLSL